MKKTLILMLMLLLLPGISSSQEVGNFLILNDIGEYKFRPNRVITIGNAGVLVPTGHFPGHGDMTYEGIYIHPQTYLGVTVKVTQHAGADSDRWLLHELGAEFRNYYGIPGDSYAVVKIDGNTIFEFGSEGWDYRWLSGNKVIMIEYTDLQMTKPEPTEVVRAYLAKHPSTLPPMTLVDLRSAEYKTMWIKDEMERRLWLCDKWLMQVQLGKAELNKILDTLVKNMFVFLDYREKYYGLTAKDEKIALVGYLSAKDETSIKSKLTGYKNWWNVNKSKSINLP